MNYLKQAWGYVVARPAAAAGGALVALVVLWLAFGRSGPALQTIVVHPGDFKQQVAVSGSVTSAQQVSLGFSQGGRVSHLYVNVGDTVQARQLLAEVENGDLAAAVLQSEASLAREQAKLDALKQGTRPEDVAVSQSAVASDEVALVAELREAYRAADDAVHNKADEVLSNPTTLPQLRFNTSDPQTETNIKTARLALEAVFPAWAASVQNINPTETADAVAFAQNDLAAVASYLAMVNRALNHAVVTANVSATTIDGYITDVAAGRAAVNTAISAVADDEAALNTAMKNLALKEAPSLQTDIDAQTAQVNAAQASVLSAQAALEKTRIKAPFSGIITSTDTKAGETAIAGTPVVSMLEERALQVEAYIPEVEIAPVKVGNKAEVYLDAFGPTAKFAATIISIDPAETMREGTPTYKVTLQFDDQDARIRAGMTANTTITTSETQNAIVIPRGALITANGTTTVKIVRGNSVVEVPVVTGASSLGQIEITSGLNDGDAVVLNP